MQPLESDLQEVIDPLGKFDEGKQRRTRRWLVPKEAGYEHADQCANPCLLDYITR